MAGAVEGLLVDGRVQPDLQLLRFDAGQFGGEFAEQRVHLRGVARALGLQQPSELALRLGVRDDRVHRRLGPADHGMRRRRVHGNLEVREVTEHAGDLLGAVLDERHQPDVVAGEHRFALAHQPRARADHPHRVLEHQATGDVGGRDLAHRVPDHRRRLGAVVAQQRGEPDLDAENADLRGTDVVVLGVVEVHLLHGVAGLVDDQFVHLVDRGAEHRVLEVELLGHLAVLCTEPGQHPHRARRDRGVGAEHEVTGLAVRERTQARDGLGMRRREHRGPRAPVVALGQRAPDVRERRVAARLGLEPVREFRGGAATARRHRCRHDEHDRQRFGALAPLGGPLGRVSSESGDPSVATAAAGATAATSGTPQSR